MRLPNSPAVCTSHVARRPPHRRLAACRTGTRAVPRNYEVPANTHNGWNRSGLGERLIYDVHKTNFGAGMSSNGRAGGPGAYGDAALVESPASTLWTGRPHVYTVDSTTHVSTCT